MPRPTAVQVGAGHSQMSKADPGSECGFAWLMWPSRSQSDASEMLHKRFSLFPVGRRSGLFWPIFVFFGDTNAQMLHLLVYLCILFGAIRAI